MEFNLAIAGVELGAFLILLVQALKFLGVTDEGWLKMGPVLGALLFAGLWAVESLVPTSKPFIDMAVQLIIAVMTAVLGYGYIAAPLARALGIKVSAGDLEE